MNSQHIADALFTRATEAGQAVVRCDASTPVDAIRAAVRHIAGQKGVSIRTGMIGDVLAVVLTDNDIWDEPVSVMRAKIPTPITFNTVH